MVILDLYITALYCVNLLIKFMAVLKENRFYSHSTSKLWTRKKAEDSSFDINCSVQYSILLLSSLKYQYREKQDNGCVILGCLLDPVLGFCMFIMKMKWVLVRTALLSFLFTKIKYQNSTRNVVIHSWCCGNKHLSWGLGHVSVW